MFLPNEERIDLKQPVSKISLILLEELIAIKIALENIKLEVERIDIKSHGNPEKSNVIVELNWTPGHAEIAGIEIADKLAKKAAEESDFMPEVDTPLTPIDVKSAVRGSCKIKWQNRWEAEQRGRHMFEFVPSVVAKKIAWASIPAQRIITQLITGYCYLNGYMHAVGLNESPLCTCGEPESAKHYIEECEQYEEIRYCSLTQAIVDFLASCFLRLK